MIAYCRVSFKCLVIVLGFVFYAQGQGHQESKTFVFGTIPSDTDAIHLGSTLTYDASLGYGFDFATAHNAIFHNNGFTTSAPVYFSVKLPEGNYSIEIVLGSDEQDSETTVKAESRRLMLREFKVPKEGRTTKTFMVNVRTPQIDKENRIDTKERELNYLNWDDKLTLEFLGKVAVQSVKVTSVENIKTIFLAGDSTVTDQDLEPWASWGQFITLYFNDDVSIANFAESGASLSSFKARKRLDKILSLIRPSDYVIIEFAHNDEKRKGEGIGPWQSYTDLLKEFITSFREKGGVPILVTPVQRRAFTATGKLKPTHGDYPGAMRATAKKLNVPVIDLTLMTTTLYESWGDAESRKAFVQYPAHTFPGQDKALEDNTHFNNFGAHEIALCVVQGIKDLDLEVAQYLQKDIPSYDARVPGKASDWTLPMSQRFEPVKPDGN